MKPPAERAEAAGAAGRRPVPVLNVRQFHENPVREMVALARHLEPVMRVRTGNGFFIHVCHPDTARHVLQTNAANYLKDFAPFSALVGDSLLAANGDKWRALRNRMQPAFAPSRLRGVAPQVVDATDRMLEAWLPAIGTGAPVDVMPGFVVSTLEFVVTALFTLPAETIEHEDFEAIEIGLRHGGRMMHFGAGIDMRARQQFTRAIRRLDSLAERIVAARRNAAEKPDDLLTLLVEALDDPGFPEMTGKQIRDDILTFLLAGHETTSTALGWTVRLISHRPEVQERMRREVEAFDGAPPSYEDLKRLPYTTAVFSEAMRMRPPVPLMIRAAAADDRIGDVDVTAGMRVGVSILGIHHHPDFWAQPNRFDPERFMGAERQPGSYLAFSAGPRSCIGSRLAMIEAPLMLARIVQRVKIAPAPNPPLVNQSIVTLRPRDGQFVRFQNWD